MSNVRTLQASELILETTLSFTPVCNCMDKSLPTSVQEGYSRGPELLCISSFLSSGGSFLNQKKKYKLEQSE